MTSILTSDVQTYVRDLISKEFRSVNNEDNAHSEKVDQIRCIARDKEPFMRTPEHSNPHGFQFGKNGGRYAARDKRT